LQQASADLIAQFVPCRCPGPTGLAGSDTEGRRPGGAGWGGREDAAGTDGEREQGEGKSGFEQIAALHWLGSRGARWRRM